MSLRKTVPSVSVRARDGLSQAVHRGDAYASSCVIDVVSAACMFERLITWLFGPPETRRMVHANFRCRADFVQAGRAYMTHPVTLYGYALPLSMLMTGLLKPEYTSSGLPEFVSHLLTFLKVAAFWLFMWACLGHVMWSAMRRGLSFVVVVIGLWLLAVLLSQAATVLLVAGADWSWTRILRQATITIPSSLVAVHASAPILRERLGYIPELVPIWLSNVSVKVPLLLKLPPEKRTRIRRIHAANQYVEVVTDAGPAMVRMSLRDAVSLIPAETGWLCHRSLWIRKEEVVALAFQRGQPQITDRNGQTFSISRAAVPEIREWLERPRPDPIPEADDAAA
jgi:DNA-binding LytR/AlgR family response regulator